MYKTTSRMKRIEKAKLDLTANLEGAENTLSKSNINVFATVIGAVAFELEQHIKYSAEQAMLLSSEPENLEPIHGKLWNVDINDASFFECTVKFTGVNGAAIPENTELQTPSGQLYLTQSESIIDNGNANIDIKAVNAGKLSNIAVGDKLSAIESIDNIISEVSLIYINKLGQDKEDSEAYRLRIKEHINNRNNTGTLADYELWAKQVPGVKQAYAKRNINGAGTVGLYVVSDDDLTNEVKVHIEKLKPVSAELHVFRPTDQKIDFNIKIKPYNPTNDQLVKSAIDKFFSSLDFEESIVASRAHKYISDLTILDDFSINLMNTTTNKGHIAKAGNITVGDLTNE